MGQWLLVMGLAGGTAFAAAAEVVSEDIAAQVSFVEELPEGWSWLRERPEDWRLVDGGLELRARPGDGDSVTTALLCPAPMLEDGPLLFEVTVTFLDEVTEQFEQAGLVWYDAGKPVFKLVHELIDGETFIIPGRVPTQSKTVTLRLLIEDGQYRAQFREEGGDAFQTVAKGELATGHDSRISLQTYHGPEAGEHWMRFTDFRVRRPVE